MIKKLLTLATFIVLASAPVIGDEDPLASSKTRLLVINVDGNDKVTLLASSVVSIARHRFLLNGSIPVDEVTIDTLGNNTVRFYCVESSEEPPSISPSSPATIPQQIGRKISSAVSKKVINGQQMLPSVQFPNGVYAHTIEYQVSNSSVLDKLYTGALAVWGAPSQKTINVNLTQ